MTGIDVTNLPCDRRGMGRYFRGILKEWALLKEEFLFITARKNVEACIQQLEEFWASPRVVTHQDPLLKKIKVCWFPWNHIHFDPGCPSAVTMHDCYPFVYPAGNGKIRKMMVNAASRSTKIITVSEFSRQELIRWLKVREEKVIVVYQGAWKTSSINDQKLPITPVEKIILFVGAMEERKNPLTLIEAFGILKKKYSIPHKLYMVGDTPPLVKEYLGFIHIAKENRKIKQTIQKLNLEDSIIIGPQDDRGLDALYRRADILVFPSLYEGFGLPLLEAFSYDIPVAASFYPPVPEVAGEAAIYFDPLNPEKMADAIIKILDNQSLRSSLIEKGRERLKRFNYSKAAEQIMDILKGISAI